MFYDQDCDEALTIKPHYETLANELKELKGLILARIDVHNNEIEEHHDSPGFKLYLKNEGEVHDYHLDIDNS